jgi:hypothetical protein
MTTIVGSVLHAYRDAVIAAIERLRYATAPLGPDDIYFRPKDVVDAEELIAEVERVFAGSADTEPAQCVWRQDDLEGVFTTTCGEAFEFIDGIDGTPTGNHVRFCRYCGRPVVEKLYVEPIDDEAGGEEDSISDTQLASERGYGGDV